MKIIVISDSHWRRDALLNVILKEDYDYLFFLGDGISDLDGLEDNRIIKVKGNCDIFSTETTERIITLDGIKFLLTHGANYKVKLGLGALVKYAKERKIDIVCFGHTHQKLNEEIEGIRFLNPGAFGTDFGYFELLIENSALKQINHIKFKK